MSDLAIAPHNGCPSVPAHPSNANVNANLASTTAKTIPGAFNGPSNTLGSVNQWLANVCCWTSAWNYQSQGTQYDDFGNFNYGATGTALGILSSALMWAGGLVKNINYWSKGQSNPYSNQPYTNSPQKTNMIAQGIQYAVNGCTN